MRWLKSLLFRYFPVQLRIQGFSYVLNCLSDLRDQAFGRAHPLVPPQRLNIAGRGDFIRLGKHNLMLCQTLAHLAPDDIILDLGCGIGRTAVALLDVLSDRGEYKGIDVIRFAIKWCDKHISSKRPNFVFVHSDVYNYVYNPRGVLQPSEYRFPFRDGQFSLVLATSLFTHLLPDAVDQYLSEIARVLAPRGRCLSSWFFLDAHTDAIAAATPGKQALHFQHRFEHHALQNQYAPEQAVAYRLEYISARFAQQGLTIEGIHFGGWSGRDSSVDSGQDIAVVRRRN